MECKCGIKLGGYYLVVAEDHDSDAAYYIWGAPLGGMDYWADSKVDIRNYIDNWDRVQHDVLDEDGNVLRFGDCNEKLDENSLP